MYKQNIHFFFHPRKSLLTFVCFIYWKFVRAPHTRQRLVVKDRRTTSSSRLFRQRKGGNTCTLSRFICQLVCGGNRQNISLSSYSRYKAIIFSIHTVNCSLLAQVVFVFLASVCSLPRTCVVCAVGEWRSNNSWRWHSKIVSLFVEVYHALSKMIFFFFFGLLEILFSLSKLNFLGTFVSLFKCKLHCFAYVQ